MNQTKANRLLQAGKDMRKAQKAYFNNRNNTNLRIAKDAERHFDKVLHDCSQSCEQQMPLSPYQPRSKEHEER